MMTSKKSTMKPKLKIPLHFNNNKHNGHHLGLPPLSPNSDTLANSVGAFPTTSLTSNNDNPRRTKSSEVIITPSPQSTTTNKNSSKRSLSNNDVGIPSLFSKTIPKQLSWIPNTLMHTTAEGMLIRISRNTMKQSKTIPKPFSFRQKILSEEKKLFSSLFGRNHAFRKLAYRSNFASDLVVVDAVTKFSKN